MLKVFVVPHTHWDREWLGTFEEYRVALVQFWHALLDLLEQNPEFKTFLLDGQTALITDFLEVVPEAADRIRGLARAGRLEVGPWFTQPDPFLADAEALIRNLRLGIRQAEAFGHPLNVAYLPDSPGLPAELPTLLAACGLQAVVFGRGMGAEAETLGSEFWWEARDGSRVLAVWLPQGHRGAVLGLRREPFRPAGEPADHTQAEPNARASLDLLRQYTRTGRLLLMHGAEHLFPHPELPGVIGRLKETLGELADFEVAGLADFIQTVTGVGTLPAHRGEFRAARFGPLKSGSLSARMPLKQRNGELLTLYVRHLEPLLALVGLPEVPGVWGLVEYGWRQILLNQAHDSIGGTVSDPVFRAVLGRFDTAEQVGRSILDRVLGRLASQVDTARLPGITAVVVVNPLPGPGSGVVAVEAEFPVEQLRKRPFPVVYDASGQLVPLQELKVEAPEPVRVPSPTTYQRLRLLVKAEGVPGLGYRAFGIDLAPSPRPVPTGLSGSKTFIENEHYRVEVGRNGTFTLVDKDLGRIWGGLGLFEDTEDAGDLYTWSPAPSSRALTTGDLIAETALLESGPVRATLEVRLRFPIPAALAEHRLGRGYLKVELPLTMRISLIAGLRRVELEVEVDNVARDHRLRVLFPSGIQAEEVLVRDLLGLVGRPVDPPSQASWVERPGRIGPQRGLLAVADGQVGLAILSDGLPEYEAIPGPQGVTLALTLLRSVGWLARADLLTREDAVGPPLKTPEAQCPGRHRFRLGLLTYGAGLGPAELLREAEAFRTGLLGVVAGRWTGERPPAGTLLDAEAPGLLLSALFATPEGLVVRFYNPGPAEETARLRLPAGYGRAFPADGLGRPAGAELRPDADGFVGLPVGPFGLRTFVLVP